MMQRNEDLCLYPWVVWHGHLFGYENLYVIDHGSDDASVQATLLRFEALGAHILRLPAAADFRDKAAFVSGALTWIDALGLYDLLFPLDCDEFMVMRDEAGRLSCAKEPLLAYLASLTGVTAPLLVQENLLNSLNNPQGFWPEPYRKVFFSKGHSGTVDAGSHQCTSRTEAEQPTRVGNAHFHHKPYAKQLMMSREKLRSYVNVDDRAALAAYRGIGWHLVANLLKTEQEYIGMMTGGSVQFPELVAAFEELGINPGFCES